MRIIIETTEAEAQHTTVERQPTGVVHPAAPAASSAPPDLPTLDAGPPPEAMLSALAGETERDEQQTEGGPQPSGDQRGPEYRQATDAGGPPSWLEQLVIDGRKPH